MPFLLGNGVKLSYWGFNAGQELSMINIPKPLGARRLSPRVLRELEELLDFRYELGFLRQQVISLRFTRL